MRQINRNRKFFHFEPAEIYLSARHEPMEVYADLSFIIFPLSLSFVSLIDYIITKDRDNGRANNVVDNLLKECTCVQISIASSSAVIVSPVRLEGDDNAILTPESLIFPSSFPRRFISIFSPG